jgi:tRNA (guanine37-N1)-methyltransferase
VASSSFYTLSRVLPWAFIQRLYGKALAKNLWNLKVINIRDAAEDKHKTVDDTPYGGGSGMLIKADVLAKSLDKNKIKGEKIIYLSPKGKKFDQYYAQELSKQKSVSLVCGHFEGVDERILSTRNIEEVSIGDYVLSGGETASFVIIDSVLRLLPGVLGNEYSKKEESFENGLLEYPQYTKPQIWEEKAVPEVLLSGDHNKIKHWRLSQSEAITRDRRPDLWQKYKKINLINTNMKTIEEINQHNVKKILSEKKLPEFFPGDVVKVGVRITEGKKERIQYFEGVCIAKKSRDLNSSFTVRKISFGEGVERTFPLYGTLIDSIKVIRSGKVRRAKLYYLRDRTGKSARIAEKIRKKIGIDVDVKPETVNEENVAPCEGRKKSS